MTVAIVVSEMFRRVLQMLMYVRTCLASSAGVSPNMESTAAMQNQAPAIGRFVRQLIAEGGSQSQLVVAYVDIARQLLAAFNGNIFSYLCIYFIAGNDWSF